MGMRMNEVALYVAANVRLPRASRGHPPRLVRVKQVTQETAVPCQFPPAELWLMEEVTSVQSVVLQEYLPETVCPPSNMDRLRAHHP
jgi:hypothetical protein